MHRYYIKNKILIDYKNSFQLNYAYLVLFQVLDKKIGSDGLWFITHTYSTVKNDKKSDKFLFQPYQLMCQYSIKLSSDNKSEYIFK